MRAKKALKIKLTLVALCSLCSAFAQQVVFTNYTYHLGSFPQCVAAGDVNGDGYRDLVAANTIDGTLTILTNNGNGLFGTNATVPAGPGSLFCVAAADVNGDSKLDLIGANQSPKTLVVLTNDGSGKFGSNATLNLGSSPNWVIAADINGDGK